ncbi:MAG: hypothetical protein JWO95_2174 [Verrucomicrobiales bacterium]|nr:hypothetical protein [Verrucomicrobiales bacterium]
MRTELFSNGRAGLLPSLSADIQQCAEKLDRFLTEIPYVLLRNLCTSTTYRNAAPKPVGFQNIHFVSPNLTFFNFI